jgi:aldose 1-epimerase
MLLRSLSASVRVTWFCEGRNLDTPAGADPRMAIDIIANDFRLTLAPETGGAIAGFSWRGVPLLRPVRDARLAAQQGHAVAAYPLVPYANRIAGAQFMLDGETFRLARNFGSSPFSIHGNGWMRPWTVVETGPLHAGLLLAHRPPHDPADEWPFAYEARQNFQLSPHGLAISLGLRNTDQRAWPAGLGLHPYVARTPCAALSFEADTMWLTGADELPTERVAVPPAMDFGRPREIGAATVDSCFAGWGGVARLTMPEHGIALVIESGPPMDHFQVYTPAGKDYCGLEPVSNMPDAINRMGSVGDQGMVWLPPGGEIHAVVRFYVAAG